MFDAFNLFDIKRVYLLSDVKPTFFSYSKSLHVYVNLSLYFNLIIIKCMCTLFQEREKRLKITDVKVLGVSLMYVLLAVLPTCLATVSSRLNMVNIKLTI